MSPGTATGNFNSSTGAVALNDSFILTFVGTGILPITCVSSPIPVALSGTWDSVTQDVTLATTSSFTIPNFAPGNANCGEATPSLNASPGGVAGAIGNAMSLALHGQFAPGLPTTTALSVSPSTSPQLAGTSVTLTATVTDPSGQGTPTGNVAFDANGAIVGSGTLSPSGTGTATATLTTKNLPQATDQLTAVYAGDSNYAGSTSSTVPYTIQALPTVTSTLPSQFTPGATDFVTPAQFSVTISDPVGGPTFTNNLFLYLGFNDYWQGLDQSYVMLDYQDAAGNWCPTGLRTGTAPPPGSGLNHAVGTYFSGFGTPPCGSEPAAMSLTPGTSVTIPMEISFTQNGDEGVSFVGPVQFQAGLFTGSCTSNSACSAVTPLSGESGVVSIGTITLLPPSGAGSLPVTMSTPFTSQTVRQNFDVALYASLTSPDALTNGGTYTAENQPPTGTVQFYVDGALVATTSNLHGTTAASSTGEYFYNVGNLAPGPHSITSNYSGDILYAPSSYTYTFTVVAGPPPGTPFTCLISGTVSTPTTFNATVVASGSGIPAGAVSGTSVTASDVNVTLDLDQAAADGPAAGLDPSGDTAIGFSPGSVSVTTGQQVKFVDSPAANPTDAIGMWSGLSVTTQVTGSPGDVVPIGVSSISFGTQEGTVNCTEASEPATLGSVAIIGTTLTASPSGSAPAGAPVTLTATVAPMPPSLTYGDPPASAPGQVDFYDGATYLGTATVSSSGLAAGTASFTTNALSVGDHQFTADWSGYSGVPPSTSNTVDYAVGTATTTALASSANPANAAKSVTFTATVSPPLGASTEPTGDVSFTSDGNPISGCSDQPLSMASPPTATCTTSFGAGQSHAIVATYSGDATYLGSASDPLTQTMLPGTNTTILSTKDPSPPGNVTFWSGVSPSSGKGATPTGTVAFTIDGATYKACNAQPLGPGGGASCTVSFKAGTTHKVFATYAGSSSYSGSKSSTITQTVTGSKSSTTPKATSGSATLASGKTLTAGQSISTGSYKLVMQSDGNLVEYQGSKALWASGTSGHPGTGVVMQKDGNLVEYQGGKAIWASGTQGHAGSHLTLQGSDGNVVIYGPGGQALWATGT